MPRNTWLSTTIGAQVTLQRGVDITKAQQRLGKVPVVSSGGISSYHDEATAKGPGVVLGRKGVVGSVYYIAEDYWPHDTTLWVKDFHGNDPRFVYYFFRYFAPQLASMDVGSANPTLNRNHVHPIGVDWPPLPEQRAIAAVLGALDDKIELNRRMNATLEGLARALFKAWFVDFEPVRARMAGRPTGLPAEIDALFPDEMEVGEEGVERPRGWRVQVLKDLVEYVIGGDWGKDERSEEFPAETYCIRGADIPSLQGGGLGSMPSRYLKLASLEKRSLRPGDLVVEISGGSPTQSTGRPVLVTKGLLSRLDKPLVCSNFCRLVRPQDEATGSFVYFWLRWLYQRDDFLAYENGTTGIKNFAFTLFSEQFPLCMPPDALMRAFEKVATSLFERMQLNGSQSDTVAKLRDALLPKLMSGEVRV